MRSQEEKKPTQKGNAFFTVVFYGPAKFRCKTAQLDAKEIDSVCGFYPREATFRKTLQTGAKLISSIRNPMLYPAELRALNTVTGYYRCDGEQTRLCIR
jgi:hypothetical protein